VRVLRAGGRPGYPAYPLLFDRHRHGDRLQGIIAFVSGGGDDLVHHLHAPKHFPEDFPEDSVGSVQLAIVRNADIELRAVIVGAPCAIVFAQRLAIETALALVFGASHQPSALVSGSGVSPFALHTMQFRGESI
jgi:hypothetical protein